MKKTLTSLFTILIFTFFLTSIWKQSELSAQNVAITDDDTYTADPSAMLDVKSLSKGMLVPRMTSAQRLLISNPATGLLVFDTNEGSFFFYNGTAWANLSSGGDAWAQTGSNVHLADSSNNVGVGTNNPQNKFIVKGDINSSSNEAIFAVVSPLGDTLFAVYPDGTRVYVNDSPAKATSSKGGFAVGGFSPAKAGVTNEYLRVTPDSVRIYIEENNGAKATANKGGFAVGGFSPAKTIINDYLSVNSDSINVSKSLYIPRMTTIERDNLGFVPSEALIIFNTTDKCMQIYENSVWSNIWCFNCAPAFIIQPVDQSICSGANANFFVSLTGTNLVYQWQISTDNGSTWSDISNGGSNPSYSGAKSLSLSMSNVPLTFNGYKYRCNVSAACPPGVISNTVVLNVGESSPTITTNPTNQDLSVSCSASFSINSIDGFGVGYQWQQSTNGTTWNNISNGGSSPVFSGTTTTTVSLTNAPLAYNNYKYRCIATNLCNADTSNLATLSVIPIVISSHPSNLNLPNSHTANFSVSISGAGTGLLYQWQESTNGGSIWNDISNGGTNPTYSGALTSAFIVSNVPPSYNNYKYRCVVSHLCRPSINSNSAILSITIPTLSTTAISFTGGVSAKSGGNITLDGGATVTSRGVCWSTSSNPVITDSYTTDGSDIGSFSSFLTSLSLGTTYYIRAYAVNSTGVAYGNQLSFTTNSTLTVGDYYQGGIIAYILQSGDPGYVDGQTHGIIAAPFDQSSEAYWGCYGSAITGASGIAIGTGAQNTIDIVTSCSEAGIAARLCNDLVLNGYSDWYLPSRNEIAKLVLNKNIIGGFGGLSYWSSTVGSVNLYSAWVRAFNSCCDEGDVGRDTPDNVRAVRAF